MGRHMLLRPLIFTACALALVAGMAESGRADDFGLSAISKIKRAVAPVECVVPALHAADLGPGVSGTAFFVSREGIFVTANHVIEKMKSLGARCNASVLLPAGGWKNENAPASAREVFPFVPGACEQDYDDDVAACRVTLNPFSNASVKDDIGPVSFETSAQPDGTEVAYLGFPQGYAWPITGRGWIASSTPVNAVPTLTIDGWSWHGVSGCPVFLSNGAVIGMLVGSESGEDEGLAVARPASLITELLRRSEILWKT